MTGGERVVRQYLHNDENSSELSDLENDWESGSDDSLSDESIAQVSMHNLCFLHLFSFTLCCNLIKLILYLGKWILDKRNDT